MGNNQAGKRIKHRANHRCVTGAVIVHTSQRFDHTCPLHLMVILANNVLFTADIEAPQQPLQLFAQIRTFRKGWLIKGLLLPSGNHLHGRQGLVDKIHVQVSRSFTIIETVELTRISEGAKHSGLHIHFFTQAHKVLKFFRRNGQGHTFLGLRKKDLPRLQAGVF